MRRAEALPGPTRGGRQRLSGMVTHRLRQDVLQRPLRGGIVQDEFSDDELRGLLRGLRVGRRARSHRLRCRRGRRRLARATPDAGADSAPGVQVRENALHALVPGLELEDEFAGGDGAREKAVGGEALGCRQVGVDGARPLAGAGPSVPHAQQRLSVARRHRAVGGEEVAGPSEVAGRKRCAGVGLQLSVVHGVRGGCTTAAGRRGDSSLSAWGPSAPPRGVLADRVGPRDDCLGGPQGKSVRRPASDFRPSRVLPPRLLGWAVPRARSGWPRGGAPRPGGRGRSKRGAPPGLLSKPSPLDAGFPRKPPAPGGLGAKRPPGPFRRHRPARHRRPELSSSNPHRPPAGFPGRGRKPPPPSARPPRADAPGRAGPPRTTRLGGLPPVATRARGRP